MGTPPISCLTTLIPKEPVINSGWAKYFMRSKERSKEMADLLYVGLTIVFLAASWGFIVVCERLREDKK
jgi:hypothetical protein